MLLGPLLNELALGALFGDFGLVHAFRRFTVGFSALRGGGGGGLLLDGYRDWFF